MSTNHYVDTNVSASGDGSSWSAAWQSFAAIDWSQVHPGDTVYVSSGTYNENVVVGASGVAGSKITITQGIDPGHNGPVIIDGGLKGCGIYSFGHSYLTISHISIQNSMYAGIMIKSAKGGVLIQYCSVFSGNPLGDGVDARGFDIRDSSGVIVSRCSYSTPENTAAQTDAIWSSNNRNVLFQYNHLVIANANDTGHSDGFQSFQDIGVTFDGNYIAHPNGGQNNQGIIVQNVATGGTVTLSNNVIDDPVNDTAGIFLQNLDANWTGGVHVYNNTIYGAFWGFAITNMPLTEIRNNILIKGASTGFAYYMGEPYPPSASIDNNVIWCPAGAPISWQAQAWANWQALGYDAHSLAADPMLICPGAHLFAPQAGSAAIGAGAALSSVVTDCAALPRINPYTIGAHQVPNALLVFSGSRPSIAGNGPDGYRSVVIAS